MEALNWLQTWYQKHCNGDWEHQYGISITTIDNPGWSIIIDLIYTKMQDLEIGIKNFDVTKNNWYGFKVTNGKFEGFGDPSKLETLILSFKKIVEENEK
jgi:hypothetical protein